MANRLPKIGARHILRDAHGLTPADRRALVALVRHPSDKARAKWTHTTVRTYTNRLVWIRDTLNIQDRTALAMWALRNGVATLEDVYDEHPCHGCGIFVGGRDNDAGDLHV